MEGENSEREIKSWLKLVLKDENIDDFSVKIVGNSEKGDGYVGDIVFVELTSNIDPNKKYDLVLKCSKRSQALRESTPVKDAFLNEIYIYDAVLPAFTKFQLEKGITDVFDSVPKCYGTLITDNMEIIVFENLKKIGYSLWDKRKPWTRKHLNMVVGEYAKFHAISIAMNEQQPGTFEELSQGLSNVFKRFMEKSDTQTMFGNSIDEIVNLLKGDLDENVLHTWKSLKEEVFFICGDMMDQINGLKVITHGDCWSNNFMFKNDVNDLPLKPAMLDWQISFLSTPVLDLSYFIFSGISKEDIQDLDNILRYYHKQLSFFVKRLGSNLEKIYSLEQFLDDWRRHCKFGVLMSSLIFKICATEKDEVIDIAQAAENGEDFTQAFTYDVKDKTVFRNRARHVVKYVAETILS